LVDRSWFARNLETVIARPTLVGRFLWWLLMSRLPFPGKEARLKPGVRWGGFASFGDYLYQKDGPNVSLREYVKSSLRTALRPVVFDVGANLGTFSLFVCSTRPEATVFAFEPIKNTFLGLQRNLEPFTPAARALRLAVGSSCEELVSFSLDPASPATAQVAGMSGVAAPEHASPMTTVDSFMESYSIDRLDLVKIDVEGYEIEVLEGASGALSKKRIAALCIEVCPRNLEGFGKTARDLFLTIRRFGYSIAYYDPRAASWERDLTLERSLAFDLADVLCRPE